MDLFAFTLLRTPILASGTAFGKNMMPNVYDGIRMDEKALRKIDGTQPGDPVRVGKVVYDISMMSSPPLHLPLGTDSYGMVTKGLQSVLKEVEGLRDIAVSTDFPKGQ